MNTEIISVCFKKILLPIVGNAISKNFEPKDRIDILEERIKRIDTFIDGHKGNGEIAQAKPIDTHITSPSTINSNVGTSCLACARSHIATVSASLKEAIRFARTEGVEHAEVQTRIATAEEEILALERYDWSPERVTNSPVEQQEIINKHLPVIRELRQDIGQIKSMPDLLTCAATSGKLLSDYRIDVLQMSKN